jgi:uncharacterized protein (DUF1330 family)
MHYLIASKAAAGLLPAGCRVIADGEALSFELPWTLGPPLVARLDDLAAVAALKAKLAAAGVNAFAVEGVAEVGAGRAILVGGHMMRDPERFKPYAEAVPAVVRAYGGKFLARGGTVTPVAGSFVPQRVVLTEYASAEQAVAWYTSDAYAPLLKIRLAATEARLLIMARSGALPAHMRETAAAYSRAAALSS